tara:strand:- start:973 stop:1269 length:297 start_codon:yes stop_codon:yes gene_type:complete
MSLNKIANTLEALGHKVEQINDDLTICKMQTKQNLTSYSDNELSLIVFNDEELYNLIWEPKKLRKHIEENFYYTEMQLKILMSDCNGEYEQAYGDHAK